MPTNKEKKEKPRFKVQREYEADWKLNYYKMLTSMTKTVIAATTKIFTDATKPTTGTRVDGNY